MIFFLLYFHSGCRMAMYSVCAASQDWLIQDLVRGRIENFKTKINVRIPYSFWSQSVSQVKHRNTVELCGICKTNKPFIISIYRGFAGQPCCMVRTMGSFSYGKKFPFLCKIFSLFLSYNMAAVQNLYWNVNGETDP